MLGVGRLCSVVFFSTESVEDATPTDGVTDSRCRGMEGAAVRAGAAIGDATGRGEEEPKPKLSPNLEVLFDLEELFSAALPPALAALGLVLAA